MTALLRACLLAPEYSTLRYRAAWLAFAVIVIGGAIPGARAEMGNVAPGVVLHASAYATITFLLLTGARGSLPARATFPAPCILSSSPPRRAGAAPRQ